MKQGNNSRRSRGRGSGKRQQRNNNVDSHGPDVRVRGTVQQVHDKYLTLARDATSSGDRIAAENYFQHAEHYYRIIAAQQENAEQRAENRDNNRNRNGRNGNGDARNAGEDQTNPDQEQAAAADSDETPKKPEGDEAEVISKSEETSKGDSQESSDDEAQVERIAQESEGDAEQPAEQATA